ncbi:hypothetical protein LOK49_LG14G01499 [Camellia lanceoleosa]|uniref:Uncharacterized protein n=1 Tax=Camellia lanceoleosa TaxID=1840588 RepID=A0ACC0FBZ7_9ERIC|nr:hypothetical protein LOK49_LG14G01499 [Camellia lanceoleosa]
MLLFKTAGAEDSILATSVLKTPLDLKNWNLGKRVFSGSHKITGGYLLTRFEIWVLVKPWFSKNARTESGFLSLRSFPSISATAQIPSTQTHLPTEIEIELDCVAVLELAFGESASDVAEDNGSGGGGRRAASVAAVVDSGLA